MGLDAWIYSPIAGEWLQLGLREILQGTAPTIVGSARKRLVAHGLLRPLRDDLISSRTQTLRGNYDLCKIISLTWGAGYGICHPGLSFAPTWKARFRWSGADAPGCSRGPRHDSQVAVRSLSKRHETLRSAETLSRIHPEEVKTLGP